VHRHQLAARVAGDIGKQAFDLLRMVLREEIFERMCARIVAGKCLGIAQTVLLPICQN
jgi:hypothetical protein